MFKRLNFMAKISTILYILFSMPLANTLFVSEIIDSGDGNATIVLGYEFQDAVAGVQFDLLTEGVFEVTDASCGDASIAWSYIEVTSSGQILGFDPQATTVGPGSGHFMNVTGTYDTQYIGDTVLVNAEENCIDPDNNCPSRFLLSSPEAVALDASFISSDWLVGSGFGDGTLDDYACSIFHPQTTAELQAAVDMWVDDNESALTNYGEINTWDVSLITDMGILFGYSPNFNDDISNWDVSNVTDMHYMFSGCLYFNQDISSWDVSGVTSMGNMFRNTQSFNQDISSWDVSQNTDFGWMFRQASSFNQDISSWDVSNGTNMQDMFKSASSFNQDISSWDVSNVQNMNEIFEGANALSEENQCAIHTSFSSNDAWPYDWSEFCYTCLEDYDDDGICDDEGNDACYGENDPEMDGMINDMDGDGICDDMDPCEGFPGEQTLWYLDEITGEFIVEYQDSDLDGLCDGWDECFGENDPEMDGMINDMDDDGVCDDVDDCLGQLGYETLYYYDELEGWWHFEQQDDDFDGVCNDVDPCLGEMYIETNWNVNPDGSYEIDYMDSDDDGVCDDMDICDGGDDNLDSDADGIPDFCDDDCNSWVCPDFPNDGSYPTLEGCAEALGCAAECVCDDDAGGEIIFQPQITEELQIAVDMWVDDNSTALSTYGEINNWDVSLITDMSNLFYDDSWNDFYSDFDYNISSWDVSNVTNMSQMFRNANSFNQDISSWDVSSVTDMEWMFDIASNFNQNISSWNVSNVIHMGHMFSSASQFNQDISAWNVSSVTNMGSMFHGATSFNQDISSWDVSSVTNMQALFVGANAFNQSLSDWDVSNVVSMNYMFEGNNSFNGDISGWNVSSVTGMHKMFVGASSFNQDISTWNVSNVTDMAHMFQHAGSFNGDISSWNVSSVFTMSHMFYGNNNFNGDISGWDVSNVTDMSRMFDGAHSFNNNLSSWDVSSVTNMSGMFWSAQSFNGDLSDWNVLNVTNMHKMFIDARIFNQDISSWDVSSVTNMGSMFQSAIAFNQDISSWDVSSVTNFNSIFNGTDALSEDNQCAIHTSWSSNENWPYDWSEFCAIGSPCDLNGDGLMGVIDCSLACVADAWLGDGICDETVPNFNCEEFNCDNGDCSDACGDLSNEINIPTEFEMNNAYPNPFNPITNLNYSIPMHTKVSIDVYNLNGELIESLYSGYKNPGEYTISWNASMVPSGLYLIKMKSASFLKVQKVMLVK